MSDVVIEARDLSKRYGNVVALDSVSLDVKKGEVLGFLGPNGAGKTTTMKILTCFTAPSSGSAKVNGFDIVDDSINVRASIGYLPESTALYTDMQVIEYLRFVAELRGLKGDEARKRIKKVVEETGLGDVFGKEIRTLSKGFKQRVGLAQALVHEPPILILDEPMSGLDPNQSVEIRDLIKDIGRKRTVILSTHNLAEVQAACDRVLIISKGKIVADDTPSGLRERAGKSRFVVSILKSNADKAAAAALEVFSKVPGSTRVREIESDDIKELSFELLPEGNDDLRPALFKAAVSAEYTLVGLRRDGQNLEQIFRDLTIAGHAGKPSDDKTNNVAAA